MNRRWICDAIWMDMLPCFDRPQLGLKLALLSPRFDVLVDAHFDGKSELTIWRQIRIHKMGAKTQLSVQDTNSNADAVPFPLPDHSLPNKIRFNRLRIECIDHSVITFLRSNQQIFDGRGTNLSLWLCPLGRDDQEIWGAFVREIWPIVAPNIRRLGFPKCDQLDNLLRRTSPTILTDLNQLTSIYLDYLLADSIADDGPNATPTACQALFEWLHTPSKDGQPKQLICCGYPAGTTEWLNNFKETFLGSTNSSASYIIRIELYEPTEIGPFELTNNGIGEKLTLEKEGQLGNQLIIKRCQIGETIQWEDENSNNLNNVHFWMDNAKCIGPMSPPKPGQKDAKSHLRMSAGPSRKRKKK